MDSVITLTKILGYKESKKQEQYDNVCLGWGHWPHVHFTEIYVQKCYISDSKRIRYSCCCFILFVSVLSHNDGLQSCLVCLLGWRRYSVHGTKGCPALDKPRPRMWAWKWASRSLLLPTSSLLDKFLLPAAAFAPGTSSALGWRLWRDTSLYVKLSLQVHFQMPLSLWPWPYSPPSPSPCCAGPYCSPPMDPRPGLPAFQPPNKQRWKKLMNSRT